MIELTPEMEAAARKRMGGTLDPWMTAAIEDVLAIVEREYTVLCGAVRPPDDSGFGPLTCNGRLGHDPDHRHLDGDWMVTWP